jgi:hypothetical protein
LSPDGTSAAFLEAKARTTEEPYTQAKVVLVDPRGRGKRREIALEGSEEPTHPYVDLAYSPDGRYLSVLFDHRVQIYRVRDGAAVSKRAGIRRRLGPEWLNAATLSSGGDLGPLLTLQGDRFVEDASRAVRWLHLTAKDRFAIQAGERRMQWNGRTGQPLPSETVPKNVSDESTPPIVLRNAREQTVTFEPITESQALVLYDDGALEVLGEPLSAASGAPLSSASLRCRFGNRLVPGEVCRDLKLEHGAYAQRFGAGLR